MASYAIKNDTIGGRAAAFLAINYVGASKDKRIARDLGISTATARLLRAGRRWTVPRLEQAKLLWPQFQAFVFPRSGDLHDRIDQVLEEIAALREEINRLGGKL